MDGVLGYMLCLTVQLNNKQMVLWMRIEVSWFEVINVILLALRVKSNNLPRGSWGLQ